jgi:hypothetical protein
MESLAASLLIWIATYSFLPALPLRPPPIVLLTPEAMTAMYYRETGSAMKEPKVDPRVLGYFRRKGPDAGTIYLISPDLVPQANRYSDPLENPIFQERLLHELVHYVQWTTGQYERFECPAAGELAAYTLGGRYLRSLGVIDPMPGRDFLAPQLSRC